MGPGVAVGDRFAPRGAGNQFRQLYLLSIFPMRRRVHLTMADITDHPKWEPDFLLVTSAYRSSSNLNRKGLEVV